KQVEYVGSQGDCLRGFVGAAEVEDAVFLQVLSQRIYAVLLKVGQLVRAEALALATIFAAQPQAQLFRRVPAQLHIAAVLWRIRQSAGGYTVLNELGFGVGV